VKLAIQALFCIFFGALGLCGCTQNIDILNNKLVLENRISYELEKVYEKRRGFFEVKVSEFRIIKKTNQVYTCTAKINYKISDPWLGEYNEMLKLGRNINLCFKKMDQYEWLSYDTFEEDNPDRNIIFSISSDPKKGGKCILFNRKIRQNPLIKIFNTCFYRDFTNLNRPLLDGTISRALTETSTEKGVFVERDGTKTRVILFASKVSGKIDVLNITKYLKEKGFPYNSSNNTYCNQDSILKIQDQDMKALFILESPKVFLFLENPTTYNSVKVSLIKPLKFTVPYNTFKKVKAVE